jgi:hypothetical protein
LEIREGRRALRTLPRKGQAGALKKGCCPFRDAPWGVQGGFYPCIFCPPGFAMPDKSLPIIDLAYRLVIEINRTVGEFPGNQRRGLGRRSEAAAFALLEALVADRYRGGAEKQSPLASASLALDRLRLLIRMAFDLHGLSPARYEELARMEREIGRMLGGWQKRGATGA